MQDNKKVKNFAKIMSKATDEEARIILAFSEGLRLGVKTTEKTTE